MNEKSCLTCEFGRECLGKDSGSAFCDFDDACVFIKDAKASACRCCNYTEIEEDVPRTNRYERWRKGRQKLVRLYHRTKNVYGLGAYYNQHKKRICKDTINSKSVRQMCNRRFRRRTNRCIDYIPSGATYRKYTEYWWSIY